MFLCIFSDNVFEMAETNFVVILCGIVHAYQGLSI